MKPVPIPGRRIARGFSLLEVLIALVILSVGLLGLAALQAEGLRGSGSAFTRTQGVLLAADITDRMRANRQALDSYVIALGDAGTNPGKRCSDTTAGDAEDPPCTGAEMAQSDIVLWKAALGNLPNGEGSITAVAGSPGRFTVLVQWSDRTTAAANETYTTVVQVD